MITLAEAVASARVNAPDRLEADEAGTRELREGWYFPLRAPESNGGEPLMAGSNGLIINRHTAACLVLGSAYSLERDLEAYDLGFQFSRYDLTITSVADELRAAQALQEIGVSVVTPETAHGVAWRIPRPLTRAELRQRWRACRARLGTCSFTSESRRFWLRGRAVGSPLRSGSIQPGAPLLTRRSAPEQGVASDVRPGIVFWGKHRQAARA